MASDLEFQDFPLEDNDDDAGKLVNEDIMDANEREILLEEGGQAASTVAADSSKAPVWTFEYYQGFFDVDTGQVIERMWRTIIPIRRGSTLIESLHGRPDLYGPIWIPTTLIFMMAVNGNFASFLASREDWVYDFEKVTFAATVVYSYILIIPLLIWSAFRFFLDSNIRLLELLCLYGYGLSVYIPISILCIFNSEILRWIVVMLATVISSITLFLNVRRFIGGTQHARMGSLILLILLLVHFTLAIGFKMYFFEYVA